MKEILFAFLLALSFPFLHAETYDTVVVGGGPAGLTAGLYTSRLGLKTLIAEGENPGGQLTTTHLVENFPGFSEGILGPDLIDNMRKQTVRYGAQIKTANVNKIDFALYPYTLELSSGETLQAKSVIIATGSSPKLLGLTSESALFGKGVSTCAVCDAPLYRDKSVVVVGGGDSAFEEALMLATFAKKVTLIHRSNQFKASSILKKRAEKTQNIEIRSNRMIKEILDPKKGEVTGVIVSDPRNGKVETIPCSGVFIAIGQTPNTSWLSGSIGLDEKGLILSTPPGVFAAGDVVDHVYRQAIVAAGAGCQAALEAYQFIQSKEEKQK